ncbi:hypothetical protein ALC62_11459 [Cyphomyrmex costatus]|uniref:CCHC-type domain-containing protein n=1 Tax=Cyphomyrmex costatus TaxID=456900 RepID=A0A151ICM7_9HYME|nr:hypothetical protein ALC62_11459 [Cyphomyrmex costatus]
MERPQFNREQLEADSLDELKRKLTLYNLTIHDTRAECIDALLTYLERRDFSSLGDSEILSGAARSSSTNSHVGSAEPTAQQDMVPISAFQQMLQTFSQEMREQRKFIQQLSEQVRSPHPSSHSPVHDSVSSASTSASTMNLASTAQSVKLLAAQLPSFGGTQDEEVEIKLIKNARDWLDMDNGLINQSWCIFKEAITKRFKRYIPFHVAMQKVEARRWNYPKETFQDYALQKMKLMHAMRLPEQDQIQLLINGINSLSLRGMAAVLDATSLNEFLEKMSKVVATCIVGPAKTSPPPVRKEKKETPSSPSKSSPPAGNTSTLWCVYCKTKGHSRSDCPKLKKKDQTPPSTGSSSSKQNSTALELTKDSTQVGCVSQTSNSEVTSIVSDEVDESRMLDLRHPVIEVTNINGSPCSLDALVDTGSPVSFIIYSTFTPSKLLLGYDQRNHADAKLVHFLEKLAKSESYFDQEREARRELAIQTTNELKEYNKTYYDRKHRKPTRYKTGDYVLIRDATVKPGDSRKFKPVYKGPYQIAKVLNKNRYVVTDIPGFNITSRPYNSILSPDRIKPWIKTVTP